MRELLLHAPHRYQLRHISLYSRNINGISRPVALNVENDTVHIDSDLHRDDEAVVRRQRTEWKRRQRGQTFLDHLTISVRGGRGGDGCVAFHREKFKRLGPPSGGNGGVGGSVYVCPSPHVTSLAGIQKHVVANPGTNGQGTWQHGRAGEDVTIHVPYGTIVREIIDPRRANGNEEPYRVLGLKDAEGREKLRQRRWVHYPQYADDNLGRAAFHEAEARVAAEDRERRRGERYRDPLVVDFEPEDDATREAREQEEINRPLAIPGAKTKHKGVLVAAGGPGGVGNPHFVSSSNRSPKFATRGLDGACLTLELELKLLADVGLVGFPNAGKSTLLNALTQRRAEVAPYAFTTLNPQVGIVRVLEGGDFDGGGGGVPDELQVEREREFGVEQVSRRRGRDDPDEIFRFTIADNPGLIADAAENVGLGHSFLRSIERARALVYVVDLSTERPSDALAVLHRELERYKPGLTAKCRLVVANKADMLVGDAEPRDEEEKVTAYTEHHGRKKLSELESWVHGNLGIVDVVPVSAKYSQNLRRIVRLMSTYVDESRRAHGPGSTASDIPREGETLHLMGK